MQLILVVGKVDMINQIARCYHFVEYYCQFVLLKKMITNLYRTCTEDYGRRLLHPHLKSLKPFNFNNSNQLLPDLRFQQSRRDN